MEKALRGGKQKGRRAARSSFRWWWLCAAGVLALACDRPEYTYDPDRPLRDGTGASGSFGGTSGVGTAGTGAVTSPPGGTPSCQLDRAVPAPALGEQTVSNQLPARRVVYAQMTDAEVEQLKRTGSLLPEATEPSQGSMLTSLLFQLQSTASELRRPLLQELVKRFAVTRSTWPNPWALRLVEHPSSQRMNPVRITLKEEAWVVRIFDGSPSIVDVNNVIVSLAAATAEPERIAAIYYVADDRSPGALATCETGKRELALGNPSMVEEFAVGTTGILERMDADIAALEALFSVVRPCSTVDRAGKTFRASTVCDSWRFFDTSTELLAYQWALATPVEAYKPTSQNLATLIQALKDDRFEPDPFTGAPPVSPVGGAGGEGGAGPQAGAAGDAGTPLGGAGGAP